MKSISFAFLLSVLSCSAFSQLKINAAPVPEKDPLEIGGKTQIIDVKNLPKHSQQFSLNHKVIKKNSANYIDIDQADCDQFLASRGNFSNEMIGVGGGESLFLPANIPSDFGLTKQVGLKAERGLDGKSIWKMTRIFVDSRDVLIRLHEMDLIGDGRGVAFEGDSVNSRIRGKPAVFSKLTAPSGGVISSLTWVNDGKLNTLEIGLDLSVNEMNKFIAAAEKMN